VGTGYSIHISRSPSVKAGRHRLSHEPAFWEYVIWRDRRLRATLILSTQLRYTHATKHDWGRSSVGRAPPLHGGGQGFESPRLHFEMCRFAGLTWREPEDHYSQVKLLAAVRQQ
jgi:hypothetical protein